MTANQIKLVTPSEYTGYQIAFKLLVQAKRLDEAEKELERARKYASPTMDFYFDYMTLELEKYKTDNDKEHFKTALGMIEKALKTVKPTVKEVVESYINAAEIYLQLEDATEPLSALMLPKIHLAYNNGFDVVVRNYEPVTLTEYDIEDMIEADRKR